MTEGPDTLFVGSLSHLDRTPRDMGGVGEAPRNEVARQRRLPPPPPLTCGNGGRLLPGAGRRFPGVVSFAVSVQRPPHRSVGRAGSSPSAGARFVRSFAGSTPAKRVWGHSRASAPIRRILGLFGVASRARQPPFVLGLQRRVLRQVPRAVSVAMTSTTTKPRNACVSGARISRRAAGSWRPDLTESDLAPGRDQGWPRSRPRSTARRECRSRAGRRTPAGARSR